MTTLTLQTVAEQPSLQERMQALIDRVWPPFILESHTAGAFQPLDWFGIYKRWPQFQFALFAADEQLVAVANALALPWHGDLANLPDDGWDWALYTGTEAYDAGQAPSMLCALSITIDPSYQGQGISGEVVRAMHRLGQAAGLDRLIAPVRPTRKHNYPLIPVQTYMGWRNADGLPFDPWLRVHARLGAQVVKGCSRSMTVRGSLAEWEEWCGLPLPGSGHYVLPGLLSPLQVNMEQDRGLYVEPNVWMVHN
jgi:GNAT superfamily N-acetyltransferase